MSSRLFAFVVWAAVAASAVFWGLRLFTRPLPVPAQASWAAPATTLPAGDLTRLFGAPAPPVADTTPTPPADSRFKLLGVVAPAAGQPAGLALISIDGGAPKAVGVGGVLEGDLTVRSVSHRRVELGSRAGGSMMVLELPVLPEPARGVPSGVSPAPTIPVVPPQAPPRTTLTRPTFAPGGMPGAMNPTPQPNFGATPMQPQQQPMQTPPSPTMPVQPAQPSDGNPASR